MSVHVVCTGHECTCSVYMWYVEVSRWRVCNAVSTALRRSDPRAGENQPRPEWISYWCTTVLSWGKLSTPSVLWCCWLGLLTCKTHYRVSENQLQLDSLSTFVNINYLTMVDNTPAVGNDCRPWVVPQSIKWLSTITRERRIPLDPESGGFPPLFGTFLSTHIGSAWRLVMTTTTTTTKLSTGQPRPEWISYRCTTMLSWGMLSAVITVGQGCTICLKGRAGHIQMWHQSGGPQCGSKGRPPGGHPGSWAAGVGSGQRPRAEADDSFSILPHNPFKMLLSFWNVKPHVAYFVILEKSSRSLEYGHLEPSLPIYSDDV